MHSLFSAFTSRAVHIEAYSRVPGPIQIFGAIPRRGGEEQDQRLFVKIEIVRGEER